METKYKVEIYGPDNHYWGTFIYTEEEIITDTNNGYRVEVVGELYE